MFDPWLGTKVPCALWHDKQKKKTHNLTSGFEGLYSYFVKKQGRIMKSFMCKHLCHYIRENKKGVGMRVRMLLLFSCHVRFFATPWTTAHQASLSFTMSQSLPKFMSIEWLIPHSHLILCRPLLLLPSIFPSIRVFSNELAFRTRWPKCWASASVLPMNIQGYFL